MENGEEETAEVVNEDEKWKRNERQKREKKREVLRS